MDYRSSYVPRKNRIKWKIILPILALIVCAIIGIKYFIKYNNNQNITTYGVCELTNLETRERIKNSDHKIEFRDYLFYGETLSLYHDYFNFNVKDEFYGKTITLVNVCDGLDYVYMLEAKVDGQIPLEDLEEGYYQVYLNKDLELYRLYYAEKLHDEFYTVTRNGKNLKIELIADKDLFNEDKEETSYLDQNYLFIKVSEEQLPEEQYDIIIDPGHLTKDQGWIERGVKANNLIESEETYKMAVLLKQYFEEEGFKVLLTRDDQNIVNSYGVDGRLYRGYAARGKYYIDVQLKASTNINMRGTQIFYSSYSSNKLANSVFTSIVDNTELVPTDYRGNGNVYGVIPCPLVDGFDGRMMIRESGGKILGAGIFSEKARSENGSFNAENRFGMQAITIEYGFISNPVDYDMWVNHKEEIARATVDGFLKYLGVK